MSHSLKSWIRVRQSWNKCKYSGCHKHKRRFIIIHPRLNGSYSKWFLNKIQIDKSLTHERSDELTSSLVVQDVSYKLQSFQLHLTETKTINKKCIVRIPRWGFIFQVNWLSVQNMLFRKVNRIFFFTFKTVDKFHLLMTAMLARRSDRNLKLISRPELR